MDDPIIRAFEGLPGFELVREGIADLRAGRTSDGSMLVAMAARRLRPLGLAIPDAVSPEAAKPMLWERLSDIHGDGAHARYNALVARILAFAEAAEGMASSARRD